MDLTYTEHSIQKQQDTHTHSSQSNMKHFLGYMMLGHKTNQQRRWKSYQVFFLLTTMVWNIRRKLGNSQIGGYQTAATEQSVGQRRKQKSSQKLRQVKMEIKHAKSSGTPEAILRGTLIMINAYVKKQGRSQKNYLTLFLKDTKKKWISSSYKEGNNKD